MASIYLSAWAREEWEPACYQLPSRRLQLAHGLSGAQLLAFIKAWTVVEGKKNMDILGVAANPEPRWPWSTTEDFAARFGEASRLGTHRKERQNVSGTGRRGAFAETKVESGAAADRLRE